MVSHHLNSKCVAVGDIKRRLNNRYAIDMAPAVFWYIFDSMAGWPAPERNHSLLEGKPGPIYFNVSSW